MYEVDIPKRKTAEQIKSEMIADIETDLYTGEGSFIMDMLSPIARELERMYNYVPNSIIPKVWVTEDSGEFIDVSADDLGLVPRKEGTKAKVLLTLTGSPKRLIARGTKVVNLDGLEFVTLDEVITDYDGNAEVTAEAVEIGTKYNVEAGTITRLQKTNAYVKTVINKEDARGGTEPESDRSLFRRVDDHKKKRPTSGNIYDYERWALEVDGVGFVRVTPCHKGGHTVKVLIADENRQPVDESIVNACKEHINESRIVCGDGQTVVSAISKKIDIEAEIEVKEGTDIEGIRLLFTDRMNKLFSEMSLWRDTVSINQVGAMLIHTAGVEDYVSLKLGGEASSIKLTEDEVPILNEVKIE